MAIDPIALARHLIDIPSTTENEYAIGEYLEHMLTELGFQTRRHDVTPSRFNLFAAAGGQPTVILNTHLDTVPPWFESREDDEFLYGRGACDAKGIIAAMIVAGEKLCAKNVTDFGFLFVVGEETDSIGAKGANREFARLGSEYVIVGEPTESKFARASKGAFTCTIRFEGVAGHSAYPERGDSAINKMISAIAEINAANWGTHDVLGHATVNVGVVRGGEKPNVIPAHAECEMIFRIVTDPQDIRARLEPLVARHGGTLVRGAGNPPQFMTVPTGAPSAIVSFNSDVPHLHALGNPLLFGPGSILDAHTADERIAKRELLAAVDAYEGMVVELLEETEA